MMPWTDRAGRLSPLKIAVLVGAAIPLGWLVADAFSGNLGPQPLNEAIHRTGNWSIRFLWMTLAITPLRRATNRSNLLSARRHLGLTALGFALLHVALYTADQQGNLWNVAREIVLRFYLTIGFVAVLAMVAMGLTSFDSAIRRLGSERWNRLHSAIYPAAILAVWHFALQRKLEVFEPIVMTGLLVWLFAARLAVRRGFALGLPAIAALGALSTALTALLEAAWYVGSSGGRIPALPVLLANVDWDLAPRPAQVVLGIAALAFVLVAVIRKKPSERRRDRPARDRAAPREPATAP